jgi:hypothetical protein
MKRKIVIKIAPGGTATFEADGVDVLILGMRAEAGHVAVEAFEVDESGNVTEMEGIGAPERVIS